MSCCGGCTPSKADAGEPKLAEEKVKYPRLLFDYDKISPKPATEPPSPTSDAARNHVPNPYDYSAISHPKIDAVRARATNPTKPNLGYSQPGDAYPASFPHFVRGRDSLRKYITSLFTERIATYDGDVGAMIRKHPEGSQLEEEGFRGERFKSWSRQTKGHSDQLTITQPQIVRGIYEQYLEEGGSDLIGTNTFSSTAIALANYGMGDYAYELNFEGARLAREACDEVTAKDPTKPRFVVGVIGPTNRTTSTPPSPEDPSARNVTFDELVDTYFEQVVALMDGGSDILMVEVLDTLNAKAALFAVGEYLEFTGLDIPVFISGTLDDQSGRTPSGQTVEALYASIRHAKPMCIGISCSLGAAHGVPSLRSLHDCAECFVLVHPKDGLPDAMGVCDVTPNELARRCRAFFENSWLNVIGGRGGTTPSHVEAIDVLAEGFASRELPDVGRPKMWLSGHEDLKVEDVHNHLGLPFLNVGERCNISGSLRFKRLMMAGDYGTAMDIARKQVVDGAHVIDINVDDGMLDGLAAMQKFVKIAETEPEVAKVPFMLDASKFEIVLAGLKWCQGKCVVNSISLKVGEKLFKEQATLLKKHGCAVVVMAFDEEGQAATEEDKVRICKRSYDMLVDEVRFPPEDIIFDPNVLTIGTGMEEHANYGVDFINATKTIKEQCPYVKISGGISNLSFGFRGVMKIRESIHSVFLQHAILESGMDVGIVNAHEMLALSDVEEDVRVAAENLVFNKTDNATDVMLELTQRERARKDALKKGKKKLIKHPRLLFDYDKIHSKPAVEPPLPTSDAARNHVPNPYDYSAISHPKIDAIRAKATNPTKPKLDYTQPHHLYPGSFPHFVRGRDSVREYITSLFTTRIAMYDGAMGTMIQNYAKRNRLEEEEFRGERFKDWGCQTKGNNDQLSITQPQIIQGIYRQYLEEGQSDIIGTNTFSSTTIAMADYEMTDYVYELNYEGGELQ